jgi:hypothetical protein
MRPLPRLLLPAAIVITGVTAASVPAARSGPGNTTQRDASFVIQAEFGVGYEVMWQSRSGDPATECSEWRESHGSTEVNAGSIGPIRGLLQVRGGTVTGTAGWGRIVVSGKAKGTVARRLVETGGSNWPSSCVGARPAPFRPPPNDCGGERQFRVPAAILGATARKFDGTLDPSPSGGTLKPLVEFWVHPPRDAYRNCRSTEAAPLYPLRVALVLKVADRRKLYGLKRGQSHTVTHEYGGACKARIPKDECSFALDLHIRIRRET